MTTTPRQAGSEGETAARQAVMALCAEASRADLEAALSGLDAPAAADLRVPETGLVMASGRIGGDGRPFNLGEVSVTRAAIRLADGPAGFDIWDISKPETPKKICHYDTSGPHSWGVHCVWCVDGEFVHMSSGAKDFEPNNPNDHQIYQIIDIRNPSKPVEAGRWWIPGQKKGETPLPRNPNFDNGYRPHNCMVYPQRPDRAYIGYIDGGVIILDISDKAHPKQVGSFNYSPPFNGFTHTAMPLFSRDILMVSDECVYDDGKDWLLKIPDMPAFSRFVRVPDLFAATGPSDTYQNGLDKRPVLLEYLPALYLKYWLSVQQTSVPSTD